MAVFRSCLPYSISFLLLIPTSSLFPQQPNLHISFFAPAASLSTPESTENSNETYLNSVTRLDGKPAGSFRPTASDLLVQQAEEKFQQGKKSYQVKATEQARQEFDQAVDLMLRASDGPTDRQLYESKLEQMVDAIHRMDLAGLGAATSDLPEFEKTPLEDILTLTFPVDPKLKSKVRDEVVATASQLPLAFNDAVLGYINYFSGRGRRTMVAGLERAGKYRPMIERIFHEEGVPPELIHLAQAESGFLPRAVSNMAATGMWQFMKFRGQEYGLKQTSFTDDRLDPEKATRAAARHLHDLYNQFGDWYLAIAAYNCGPGNVQKAVERTGYADFFELRSRHAIPVETTNYVPIILAMTIMTKNAAEYGLTDVVPESPIEYDTVDISSATHLALIGDLTDTPVSQLTQLNPSLLRNIAPSGYSLHVPKGTGTTLMTAMQNIPEERRASWRMHRVESGDTLAGIAKRYGAVQSSIAEVNKLATDSPAAGDYLIIPANFKEGSAAPLHVSGRHSSKNKHAAAHRAPVSRAHLTRRSQSRSNTRRAFVHHASSGVLALNRN